MGYKELRKELLAKLGVTPQRLSQMRKKIKDILPMTAEEATCIIAHNKEIDISRYLEEEDLKRIRGLIAKIKASNRNDQIGKKGKEIKSRSQSKKEIVIKFPDDYKIRNSILRDKEIREAKKMAILYPLLYVFENTLREFIIRFMRDKYGADWWDKISNNKINNIKQDVKGRIKDEENNPWHGKRGSHPIFYTDLKELIPIAKKIEKDIVPVIFENFSWLENIIKDVARSRNIICHMNPLKNKNDEEYLRQRIRVLLDQINGKKDLIPG